MRGEIAELNRVLPGFKRSLPWRIIAMLRRKQDPLTVGPERVEHRGPIKQGCLHRSNGVA